MTFASLRSNVIFALFKGFLTWVQWLVRIGGKLPPSMLKKPWFQKKHWGTLTNWIWPILLSKQSICSVHSRISHLLRVAHQSRASKNKNWRVGTFKNDYRNNREFTIEIIEKSWNYFQKLIFNQKAAAPQKVPPWVRRPQGSSLATPLVLHLVHQLPLSEFVLSWITCGLIIEAETLNLSIFVAIFSHIN